MTALAVRTATEADAETVGRVLAASYPALMAGAYESALLARALPLMTQPNPRLLASGTYYLCEAGGTAVGCGGWSFDPPPGGERADGLAHIRHFATEAGWTGRGVGRALYERCEADARAAGARELHCWSSRNGERFYAAMGFERVGDIAAPMGPELAFPSVLMRRTL